MKQLLTILRTVVLLIIVTHFSSCQKIIDKIFNRGNHNSTGCTVKTIKQEIFEGSFRTATFYNNSRGNPDSVIFDVSAGSAGAQLYYYWYDNQNRLIAFDSYYDTDRDVHFFKHRYGYDELGRIKTDTVDICQAGCWTTVLDLQYDNQNRVVSEVGRVIVSDGEPVPNPEPFTLNYPYDSRGNLVPANDIYDEKVSFLRTSNVLMFTERNYSRNNPIGASGYNEQSLPLGFPDFTENMFPTSHWALIQRNAPTEITYDCKDEYGKGD